MVKYVRETKAGKSISAYVVLNKRGVHVATVQFHFSDSGNCTVNVWNTQAGIAACAKANKIDCPIKADNLYRFQSDTTGGWGYDKSTAALAGMWIDGHVMTNHCCVKLKLPKGRKVFPRDFKVPKGYRLANWVSAERSPDGVEGYADCYREAGLRYLESIGYQVISAI